MAGGLVICGPVGLVLAIVYLTSIRPKLDAKTPFQEL